MSDNKEPIKGLMSVNEAFSYVGAGRRAGYEHVMHDPELPRVRYGGRVFFRRDDLDRWIERHTIPGDAPGAVLPGRGRGYRKRETRETSDRLA